MKDIKKLKDMLDAIEAVEGYTDLSYGELLKDPKTQDAIMFNLVVLGEAANRISDEFKMDHQGIPWSSIIGTRNVIVHGYATIENETIWGILQEHMEALRCQVGKLLDE